VSEALAFLFQARGKPECQFGPRRSKLLDRYAQIRITVSYEWDAAKARANYAEHGVHFADATAVLEDDYALTVRDP
jgi:hypothetical protein